MADKQRRDRGAGSYRQRPGGTWQGQYQGRFVSAKTEAERITAVISGLSEPNSPNKTHYAVKVSHEFMRNASNNDTGKLLRALPFKNAMLGGLKGEKGIFVTVPKERLRKRSILGKLDAAKDKAASQDQRPDKNQTKKAKECL